MEQGFSRFLWRVTASHTLTYFIFGLLAASLFDYRSWFETESLKGFMVSMDAPQVAAGPALQLLRGVLFALVLWPIHQAFLQPERGWLYLWILFIGLAILGTAGPSPGSIEGVIYTQLPLFYNVFGLPEVLLQTLAFSLMLTQWYRHPTPWWNRIMIPAIVLIVLMSLLGYMVAAGVIEVPAGN
ncbi:MAG: hypothetical protein HUJ29_02460 [Gammaproteobacteria bacterium]|nr:hypothetical protein [Gammaproteobacteria bacterium]